MQDAREFRVFYIIFSFICKLCSHALFAFSYLVILCLQNRASLLTWCFPQSFPHFILICRPLPFSPLFRTCTFQRSGLIFPLHFFTFFLHFFFIHSHVFQPFFNLTFHHFLALSFLVFVCPSRFRISRMKLEQQQWPCLPFDSPALSHSYLRRKKQLKAARVPFLRSLVQCAVQSKNIQVKIKHFIHAHRINHKMSQVRFETGDKF